MVYLCSRFILALFLNMDIIYCFILLIKEFAADQKKRGFENISTRYTIDYVKKIQMQ